VGHAEVGAGGRGGHVGAVTLAVLAVAAVADEVGHAADAAGELLVAGVDTGVHDVDVHARAVTTEVVVLAVAGQVALVDAVDAVSLGGLGLVNRDDAVLLDVGHIVVLQDAREILLAQLGLDRGD